MLLEIVIRPVQTSNSKHFYTGLERTVTVGDHVHLDRTFSPLHATDKDAENHEIMTFVEGRRLINWVGVEGSHRAVILAGAGIGKTHEMKRRAKEKREAGDASRSL